MNSNASEVSGSPSSRVRNARLSFAHERRLFAFGGERRRVALLRRSAGYARDLHPGAHAGPVRVGIRGDAGDDDLAFDPADVDAQRHRFLTAPQRHEFRRLDAGMRVAQFTCHPVEHVPEVIVVPGVQRQRPVAGADRAPVDTVESGIDVPFVDGIPDKVECRGAPPFAQHIELKVGVGLAHVPRQDVVRIQRRAAAQQQRNAQDQFVYRLQHVRLLNSMAVRRPAPPVRSMAPPRATTAGPEAPAPRTTGKNQTIRFARRCSRSRHWQTCAAPRRGW